MFHFTRFRSCPTNLAAQAATGKWAESTIMSTSGGRGGTPNIPAPNPATNPFLIGEIKVPTSALRIKNKLTISKTQAAQQPRQQVQLKAAPKVTPPRVPDLKTNMMSLSEAIVKTKSDVEKADNGIKRLWGLATAASTSTNNKINNNNSAVFQNESGSSSTID